jgi:hypothetical protein
MPNVYQPPPTPPRLSTTAETTDDGTPARIGGNVGDMSPTIADKLEIKPHSTVWLSDPAHLTLLTPMPDGVREVDMLATASTAILFAEDAAAARTVLTDHAPDLSKPGVLWLAFPDGTDAEALGRAITDADLRPDGRVAIDDHWSAVRCRPR